MTISKYDIDNIQEIIRGQGDWFNAKLLRLMADADMTNLDRLAEAFPDVFVEFARWKWKSMPKYFANNPSVVNIMGGGKTDLDWAYPMRVVSARDF